LHERGPHFPQRVQPLLGALQIRLFSLQLRAQRTLVLVKIFAPLVQLLDVVADVVDLLSNRTLDLRVRVAAAHAHAVM
jgi:hypothetical protein